MAARGVAGCAWLCVAVGAATVGALAADAALGSDLARGRMLFERRWETHDRESPGGDGVGPLYNARSCADCHFQGGVGGAGPNDRNVDLLTAERITGSQRFSVDEFADRLTTIHPSLAASAGDAGAAIVLHRYSTDDHYDYWRRALLANLFDASPRRGSAQHRLASFTRSNEPRSVGGQRLGGVRFALVQRSTPALFGLGLIDRIADEALAAVAAEQSTSGGVVHGRAAKLADGRLGRFGWRGQTATLADFVQGACANELGLELPRLPQAANPRTPRYKTPGVDLESSDVDALIHFVASLPAPKPSLPRDISAAQQAVGGERVFERIGCAECHRPNLGGVRQIYSDLLLHDLGASLADSVAAPVEPINPSAASPVERIISIYSGTIARSVEASGDDPRREWRTPPLWGVRDSGPYLHDGRAETLAEAIEWHGGEARVAASAWRRLTRRDRANLLAFIESLAAPAGE